MSIQKKNIVKFSQGQFVPQEDQIAIEAPLEIRIVQHLPKGTIQKRLAVTMRTPGQDEDLVRGFLFTEGIIQGLDQILNIKIIDTDILEVTLSNDAQFNLDDIDRNFFVSSSCGVCGKASKENIETESPFLPWASKLKINAEIFSKTLSHLKKNQPLFASTGGVHGVALIDESGEIKMVFEDVGRHNAMDKLIGSALQEFGLPLSQHIILVSGRASFELVQKAGMAGIPLLAAIGAPSSLAIETAEAMGMSLIGFLKSGSFNVYSGEERVSK